MIELKPRLIKQYISNLIYFSYISNYITLLAATYVMCFSFQHERRWQFLNVLYAINFLKYPEGSSKNFVFYEEVREFLLHFTTVICEETYLEVYTDEPKHLSKNNTAQLWLILMRAAMHLNFSSLLSDVPWYSQISNRAHG